MPCWWGLDDADCIPAESQIFVAASHQTRLDTRSKARRPIKVGIKGRGRSGRSRDSNPACQCCSSAHLVQCEPDEASSFTNPNVGPGTYASLRLKLDAWSSAVQRGQKCSSPTRRLPSRSWGPIRPRVCSWFRAPIRHECQTAQLKSQDTHKMGYPRYDYFLGEGWKRGKRNERKIWKIKSKPPKACSSKGLIQIRYGWLFFLFWRSWPHEIWLIIRWATLIKDSR